MPRSAADATRFTATGPYASSKPSVSIASSSIALGQGAPPNESPQQKIARLRAAANRAKLSNETRFDKVVRVGRVWADRAHRTTAWGLIGLTVVCGVFASFAIGDMLIHNRKKRKEWLEEQQANTSRLLGIARIAASQGTADDDQILLLNRERAAQEAETARMSNKGIFRKTREAVFGAAKEEERGGKILAEVRRAQDAAEKQKSSQPTNMPPPSGFLEDMNAAPQQAQTQTKAVVPSPAQGLARGGPLDRQAQASLDALAQGPSGWFGGAAGR